MDTTIALDEQHYKTAVEKARGLGTTPQSYIHSLIDAADSTLDQLLTPVRQAVKESGMSEDELTEMLERSKHEMRAEQSAQGR
jgi:hypothetical protein